jgi:hypothetical protein
MVGWWLFKWRRFMSIVTGGEWGKVKRRHLNMTNAKRKE